eukprot:gnl/TRDRNA2_/TRDRNA2_54645_c0_seq1.p1 gnl/TRDRNA2_/TRDRNA2_54645_c0~~gnl/TRDRNA2_/TRDRNA2_54645_c0_seq1.p1  ORF type:complete len:268 (+),score=55.45 gnl/TRDRNA2_/TRDRNA2_54645_c0_seq1:115-918(+)
MQLRLLVLAAEGLFLVAARENAQGTSANHRFDDEKNGLTSFVQKDVRLTKRSLLQERTDTKCTSADTDHTDASLLSREASSSTNATDATRKLREAIVSHVSRNSHRYTPKTGTPMDRGPLVVRPLGSSDQHGQLKKAFTSFIQRNNHRVLIRDERLSPIELLNYIGIGGAGETNGDAKSDSISTASRDPAADIIDAAKDAVHEANEFVAQRSKKKAAPPIDLIDLGAVALTEDQMVNAHDRLQEPGSPTFQNKPFDIKLKSEATGFV